MSVSTIDLIVIASYVLLALALGVSVRKRSEKTREGYFLGGRKLTWWMAGTSLAATTFASDTPLWVTDLVRKIGISAGWLEWAPIWGGAVAAVLMARLLRRSRVTTDAELIELRYPGGLAGPLRAAFGLYNGVLINVVILGWVVGAMGFWAQESIGISQGVAVPAALAIALGYSYFSGLFGVVATDLMQFVVATAGAFVLAILAVHEVGGLGVMTEKLHGLSNWPGHELEVMPSFGEVLPWTLGLALFGVQWVFWANPQVYAGQRVLACRTEADAARAPVLALLLRFVLIPWLWIVVAVASLLILPSLENDQLAYPRMVMLVLPDGLRGLMLAAMLAAFMSTIDTHLNWGASYLVHDIYARFFRRDATEEHYLKIAHGCVLALAIVSAIIGLQLTSIVANLLFVFALISAISPMLLARWFWWRASAKGEFAGLVTAVLVVPALEFVIPYWQGSGMSGARICIAALVSTTVWLVTTLATKAPNPESLVAFYEQLNPPGAWSPVAALAAKPRPWPHRTLVVGGVVCVVAGYSLIFAVGKLLFGDVTQGLALLGLSGVAAIAFVHQLRVIDSKQGAVLRE